MRSVEEKNCYSNGFEFHRGNGTNLPSHHRTPLGKPTPSKWDDAQKWLVGFARGGEKDQSKANNKPRNSNADDRRLIAPVPQKEQDYSSTEEEEGEEGEGEGEEGEGEDRNVECDKESIWRINKNSAASSAVPVKSICVRDMGTEMTPIVSQEPSRTATPIRATTPAARSPVNSGSNTPVRYGVQCNEGHHQVKGRGGQTVVSSNGCSNDYGSVDQGRKMNPLETRAVAWDEAERAKYMAKYKREEVNIQAWENHEKRKAEMQMKKMEVKVERMKAREQEKLTNKLAATRRIAEEKRANAEAKLNEKAVRTSERADYIRRTGHLPSSLSFKLPSLCW